MPRNTEETLKEVADDVFRVTYRNLKRRELKNVQRTMTEEQAEEWMFDRFIVKIEDAESGVEIDPDDLYNDETAQVLNLIMADIQKGTSLRGKSTQPSPAPTSTRHRFQRR